MSPFDKASSPALYACAFVILACASFLASANCGKAVSNLDLSLFAKSFKTSFSNRNTLELNFVEKYQNP